MLARTQLLHIQRSLYRRLQEYAKHSLGGLNHDLKRYFEEYRLELTQFESIATKRELLQKVQNSHLILVGDYHTLPQAQRTVIRILRDCITRLKLHNRRIILALEMARASDTKAIKQFLSDELTETQFLKKISFQRHWGFQWENYRGLLQFAKEHRLEVIGINCAPTKSKSPLQARDRFIAKELAEAASDPSALVVALIGDLHLADPHLPAKIRSECKRKKMSRKLLVIHQNVERYYWNLVSSGLEQLVDVVRVRPDVYCILNTPPWIKLQSHVKWMELMAEGGLDTPDALSKPSTYLEGFMSANQVDEIAAYVEMISRFFEIEAPASNDFSVYCPLDQSPLPKLKQKQFYSPKELKFIGDCVGEFKSFFIPKANILYLSTISPNHSASQAAHYLHAQVSGFDAVFQKPEKDFYRFVWTEALAFLGSKVINHKRKCQGQKDLERIVDQSGHRLDKTRRQENAAVAKFVLEVMDREQRTKKTGPDFNSKRPLIFYYKAAKVLGSLLGQALYTAAREDVIPRSALRELLTTPLHKESPRRIEQLYFDWLRQLDERGYRPSSHSEHL